MTSPILDLDLPHDHPLRQILDVIAAHPEVREPLLRVLLTEEFLALPGQVQELRADLADFKEETREQLRVVNERLDENTRRLDGVSLRLDENIRLTRSIQGSVGALRGNSYEDLCRKEIAAILDGWLERAVLADREHLNERLSERRHRDLLSRQDFLEGLRPDIIARAKTDTSESLLFAVVEVSITFNRNDLEAAARRAGIISDATDVPANAFLVTHHAWPDEMNAVARQLSVTIIRHEAPQYADV